MLYDDSVRRVTLQYLFLLLLLLFGGGTPEVRAAVKFWDGSSSGNWNLGANWTDGVAPVAGDDLVFPPGAVRLVVTNNFSPNRAFRSVTFQGSNYFVRAIAGNTLTVTNGISAQNPFAFNTIDADIVLGAIQTFDCLNSLATLDINGGVSLGAHGLTINGPGDVFIAGAITGTGGVTKFGLGTLLYNGPAPNTYSGLTRINAGTLELSKSGIAIAGDLVIGDGLGGVNSDVVRLLLSNQIANLSEVTIDESGRLDLNNQSETIGPLILFEGSISTGTGTLTLNGDITATGLAAGPINGAVISGRLNLGTGTRTIETLFGGNSAALYIDATVSGTNGFTKIGSGSMRLGSSNSYTGVTIIADGTLAIEDSDALGSFASADGTVVQNGAALLLATSGIDVAERLDLRGTGFSAGLGALWTGNGVVCTYSGILTLDADANIGVVGASGRLTIPNRIAGPGGLTKVNNGTLVISGTTDNTYDGATIVNEGTLELAKSGGAIAAITGSALIIGDGVGGVNADVVRYTGTSASQLQTTVPVTINTSGLLDLNGHTDDIGTLTMNAGRITTGTGTLVLFANVTATSDATGIAFISGRVQLNSTRTFNVTSGGSFLPDLRIAANIIGAGGITKAGNGEFALGGSNSYTGTTTVMAGGLAAENSFALGSTNGPTIVQGSATLFMVGPIHVGLEHLTVSSDTNRFGIFAYGGSNSWAGNVVLSSDIAIRVGTATDDFRLSGAINGAGGLTKTGPGTLYLSGNVGNTYLSLTRVNEGRLVANKTVTDGGIPGDLIIGDGVGGVNADVVEVLGAAQISDFGAVTINNSGLLEFNVPFDENIGSLAGSGRVTLQSAGSRIDTGRDNTSTFFSGIISGPGGLMKEGTGTMALGGNNTYTGTTTVTGGRLDVNGNQQQSPVTVNSLGTLGGHGTVGNINIAGGIVAPGSSQGVLTMSNLVLQVDSEFNVELNGPNPGTGYDQANVRGTVSLGGAFATLNVDVGFPPSEGDRFTIINNDGVDAVLGNFAGLPNGAGLTADGLNFKILYNDGNDVVLIVTNTALRVTNLVVSTGNGNAAVDPNECNELTIPLRNPFAGVLVTGVSGLLSTETPGVVVTQPYSTYPDVPGGATRNNLTPFQFSTRSDLLCGTNIDFTLTVATASNGTFQIHFSLPTGSPGAPIAFDNNTVQGIPDLGTVDSTINVAGITTPIKRVTVSLHITHTAASDLDISLIGPDGTTVDLSSDNGGTASDYGTDCTGAGRTLFTDLAAVAITAGSAPFVGSFRPEQTLRAFNEKFGTDVNGTWTLRVTDDTGGAVGSIRCWTLSILPTVCAPADGPCEGCGGPIAGSITLGDPLQTGRLNRNGTRSSCETPKACPTLFNSTPVHYDAYTFTNGTVDACVVVQLSTPCGNNSLFTAAYAGAYNPSALCANYLGDPGLSSLNSSYAFFVPSNSVFTVVVHEVSAGVGCTNYTLNVGGFECPPRLEIERASVNRYALKWSTSSPGYRLHSATEISSPPSFDNVLGTPFVVGGKYTLTNLSTVPKRFYRLRKP
jgi:autotransporter-associated beta strand protein